MTLEWSQVNRRLHQAADILNQDGALAYQGPLRVGIDLGTADVVLMALDQDYRPLAAFLEWAEVVRDGVVVDFIGAADIVGRLLARAGERLGRRITAAATSFPPGTDSRLSTNILERAGLEVTAVKDEPHFLAALLRLDRTAFVDVGGGTTGTAVFQEGRVVMSADEPTGGHHLTLTIAGHYGVNYQEAERRKRRPRQYHIFKLVLPTLQRICDIVAGHIQGLAVERIVLSGGTCCLPGIEQVFTRELGLPVLLPDHPLLLTPLAIAAGCPPQSA